jgi:nicotinamide-nucleotide amidase
MNQLAAQVGAALQAHGMMLAAAESCTGGGVATAVTEIAGSSAWCWACRTTPWRASVR